MMYEPAANKKQSTTEIHESSVVDNRVAVSGYILNLIDTPGHPDFSYEVSRALEAVEGAILLVDVTQGIQAQTLSNFYAAKKAGLTVIGAVNKIDMAADHMEETIKSVADLVGCSPGAIHRISGKTGAGVGALLNDVVKKISSPKMPVDKNKIQTGEDSGLNRGLIFDSFYDDHKGIIAAIRMYEGSFKAGDAADFIAVQERVKIKEVGMFLPQLTPALKISSGEIGYLVTGLKDPSKIKIGDTILSNSKSETSVLPAGKRNLKQWALPGYREPKPVVFVSFFPDDPGEYDDLKKSLDRLKLNDSSLSFEPDFNEVLGRGFRGGFLGKLHFEIASQRLEREFDIKTVTSFPSVAYRLKTNLTLPGHIKKDEEGYAIIQNAKDLPDEYEQILEPMIRVEIVSPQRLLGAVLSLKDIFRWQRVETDILADKVLIRTRMPLSELISDFDDRLKSVSGGFASFSYEGDGFEKGDLLRLDILVAGETVPGLSRILPRRTIEREARLLASRLKDTLPRQQFPQAIQAKSGGRIIARETIAALRKDVTGYLYGGDRTRKMKLWKKQKKGKKKLLSMARVKISAQDFKKFLSK